MAWWDKIVSAAKSALNKAKSLVSKVSSSVKRAAEKALKKAKAALKKAKKKAKDAAKKAAKKAKDKIKKAKRKAREKAEKAAEKAKEAARRVADAIRKRAEDAARKAADATRKVAEAIRKRAEDAARKAADVVSRINWIGILLNTFRPHLPFIGKPKFDIIKSIYETVTGKKLTEAEWARIKLDAADWALGLNTLSKLFLGKNLDGTPGKVETTDDYINLVTFALFFIPVAKLGGVAAKLGWKGYIKLFATRAAKATTLFKKLNVDDQAKMIRGLLKTDEGVTIINKLLAAKVVHKTLVKPTISIVDKAIAKRILEGAGLSRFLTKALRPKTIIWSLTGMISLIGLAYGIPFGTSWLAKEGIKEQFEIPLADRMRSYRFEPTVEKLEIIRDDIKKLREVLPIAETTIKKVAWLWPLTREAWEAYADNLYFTIEQYEKELELMLPPELMVLPEKVEAVVRDIIDGDTIDLDLEAKDQETGRDIKLPEYRTTGHARVRILGINAPEKSPKGEILCTDIEIFNVEKEFADKSRDALLPLNDRKVILKIDPENAVDTYERILAVVELAGQDIGLRQINEGLACAYIREENKYLDEDLYLDHTFEAKDEGTGMWKGLEEVEKEEDKIKIKITSKPDNARLFLDDVALRHNTPSDEVELSDVIHLFSLGDHVLSAQKAGLSAMVDIEIVKGDNGTIHLDLETAPLEEDVIIAEMENHLFERAEEVESMVEKILEVTMIRPPKIFVGKVFEVMPAGVRAKHYSIDNSIRFSKSYWLDAYKTDPEWYLALEGVFAHELTHEIQGQVIGVEEFVEIYKRDRTEMEALANAVKSKVVRKDVTSIWPYKGLTEEEWFAGVVSEEVEEEEIEEEVIEEVTEPIKVSEIPKPFTSEQVWALNEAFTKILVLTEGTAIMSKKERAKLINSFSMHADGQKEVLTLLWKDLIFYTQGRKQLSADEYIELKEKYKQL